MQKLRTILGTITMTTKNRKAICIHDSKYSSGAFDKCAIENKVSNPCEVHLDSGGCRKLLAYDTTKRRRCLASLFGKLPDTITFDNPALKPNPPSSPTVYLILSDKAAPTVSTEPSLLGKAISPVAFDCRRATYRTVSFFSSNRASKMRLLKHFN